MITITEFQLVDINKLVPYANNARTHNKEQILKLRSSLREFGFVNPVIIDKEYNVLAGHGRIEAAKEEGIAEVPCVYADHLTEAQKKAYILADNRMALDAGWDDELLAVEMEELQNLGFDLGLTGFDESEIADLFDTNSGDEVKDDDFDLTTALEKAAFVQRGDIWTVGKHKLMCGDATSAEDVSALMLASCYSRILDQGIPRADYHLYRIWCFVSLCTDRLEVYQRLFISISLWYGALRSLYDD